MVASRARRSRQDDGSLPGIEDCQYASSYVIAYNTDVPLDHSVLQSSFGVLEGDVST